MKTTGISFSTTPTLYGLTLSYKVAISRIPPNAEYSSDGYVQFPFWPELQYLKNVCKKDAPKEIIQEIIRIVLQLPTVDNPRVYDNILDIALELDGEQSARLKSKMLEYTRLKHQFLSFEFPKLLLTGRLRTKRKPHWNLPIYSFSLFPTLS